MSVSAWVHAPAMIEMVELVWTCKIISAQRRQARIYTHS
jgi:hypothetical protein